MKRLTARFTPMKVALFYACIGGLWVVVNIVTLLANLVLERHLLYAIEVSNVVFVLVTALLLYVLITKSRHEGMIGGREPLARLVRALKAYSECHQALIRAVDERQLMNAICRIFIEVGGYRMAWVGIAEDDEDKTITPVAGWGDDRDFVEVFKSTCMNKDMGLGPIKTALRTGKPVVLQNMQKEPTCEICRIRCLQQGFCSSIFLPMNNRGQTFAALMIYSSGEGVFDDEEVALLSDLVDDLAYGIIALRIAQENQKTEQQRQLLSSVIMQMRSGLFLLDNQELIQFANPAAERITGVPVAELIGNSIHSLSQSNKDNVLYGTLLPHIVDGNAHSGHFQYRRQDGALLELELTTWTVTDTDDSVISHVGMIRDITTEMQLENQLRRAQRMEAIGILAGGIAHDFNNALASIITCTELALDEAGEGSMMKELLDVVLKSGLRGKDLVRQILTFSRQTEQQRQEVKVDLIVKECLKLLRSTLSPAIEIRLQIGNGLKTVFADPTQVHQIVMNLCTNAVHAIRDQGRGVIELLLEHDELDQEKAERFADLKPGRYLLLTVRDNGHGMDATTLERIFDPFFSTKGQSEGTGLGLSVIHGIISRLGGAITVQSSPGNGSRFDVYLPVMQPDLKPTEEVTPEPSVQSGAERILLVDDDHQLIFSAQLMLRQLGYQVEAHTDPERALQLFHDGHDQFDLVITDQAMPQMSGMELASRLNQICPDMPIVLCTGYDPSAGYGTDETGQIADYISELAIKPLERHELAETIRRALDTRNKTEECDGQPSDY